MIWTDYLLALGSFGLPLAAYIIYLDWTQNES